jgi:hypothetical protein
VRHRFLTWPLWTGFLLCIVALFSYPFFFVRFPVTRDFPWVNLLLYCVAAALIVAGLQRSFGIAGKRRTRIIGSILTVFSALVFALFIFVVFIFPRQLPASSHAPQVGQKAPPFTLTDTSGNSVSLSDLLTKPIDGKAPAGVLLVFYRGYW